MIHQWKSQTESQYAQVGGRSRSARTDHILIMQESLATVHQRKKTHNIPRCHKNLWQGIAREDNVCNVQGWIKGEVNNNTNTKAKIKTKYGHTRIISITDSIKQGGVLLMVIFVLIMIKSHKKWQLNNCEYW